MPNHPHPRSSNAAGAGFSFRWGIPVLDELPYTVLYHFLLDHYAALGMDATEMMLIIHLSQFRHETPSGQATPSLGTIARLMGFKDEQPTRRLKQRLIHKGLLRVTPQLGAPDIYDVAPFAAAAFALWQAEHPSPLSGETPIPRQTPVSGETPLPRHTPLSRDSPTPLSTNRGGVSLDIPENKRKEKTKRNTDSKHAAAPATRGIADPLPSSPYITAVIGDFSRELGDDRHAVANTTQALRLWGQSNLDEAAFVAHLQEARQRTRRYQGRQGSGTIDHKMAYFFQVLRDQLPRGAA